MIAGVGCGNLRSSLQVASEVSDRGRPARSEGTRARAFLLVFVVSCAAVHDPPAVRERGFVEKPWSLPPKTSWKTLTPAWALKGRFSHYPIAVMADGLIVLRTHETLIGVEPASGAIKWKAASDFNSYAKPFSLGSSLLVADFDIGWGGGRDFSVRLYRVADGRMLWRKVLGCVVHSAVRTGDHIVVNCTEPRKVISIPSSYDHSQIIALDGATGDPKWRRRIRHGGVLLTSFGPDVLVNDGPDCSMDRSSSKLVVLSSVDGSEVRSLPGARPAESLYIHDGLVIISGLRGDRAFRVSDGTAVWSREEEPEFGRGPIFMSRKEGDSLVVADRRRSRLLRLALSTGRVFGVWHVPHWRPLDTTPGGKYGIWSGKLQVGTDVIAAWLGGGMGEEVPLVIWRNGVPNVFLSPPHLTSVSGDFVDNYLLTNDDTSVRAYDLARQP